MKHGLILTLFLFFTVSCGDSKKQEIKKDEASVKTDQSAGESSDPATSLDELVYEAEGRSVIKSESPARSQAELKGRAALLKELETDAATLISGFMETNKNLLDVPATPEDWAKALRDHFNSEKFVLKGSVALEYGKSETGDTLLASMSLPLMAGYEVIETALVDVGTVKKFLSSAKSGVFKKAFREYYLTEKKKLLTMPS